MIQTAVSLKKHSHNIITLHQKAANNQSACRFEKDLMN